MDFIQFRREVFLFSEATQRELSLTTDRSNRSFQLVRSNRHEAIFDPIGIFQFLVDLFQVGSISLQFPFSGERIESGLFALCSNNGNNQAGNNKGQKLDNSIEVWLNS